MITMSTTYAPASTLAVSHSMVVPKAKGASTASRSASQAPAHDVLYGLPLARTFDDELERAVRVAESTGDVVSLVLIRVGFDRGLLTPAERAVEAATRAMVAAELRRVCRQGDVIGRHDDAAPGVDAVREVRQRVRPLRLNGRDQLRHELADEVDGDNRAQRVAVDHQRFAALLGREDEKRGEPREGDDGHLRDRPEARRVAGSPRSVRPTPPIGFG